MLETLRSPRGRIAFAVVATVLLLAAMLLIEPGMVAFTPALVAPIWISVIGTDWFEQHRTAVRWLTVAGTVTLLLGVLAFVIAN